MAKHALVTEMSDVGGAITSGPESRYVIDAVGSVLDGIAAGGHDCLAAGAAATSWAAVLHRLDVAGRALALDAGIAPADAPSLAADVASLALAAHADPTPDGLDEVLAAWSGGRGIPVPVDLTSGAVDPVAEDERAFAGCLVLAWLVDRSGFPPQVVA
jgi:hypothetical protein